MTERMRQDPNKFTLTKGCKVFLEREKTASTAEEVSVTHDPRSGKTSWFVPSAETVETVIVTVDGWEAVGADLYVTVVENTSPTGTYVVPLHKIKGRVDAVLSRSGTVIP